MHSVTSRTSQRVAADVGDPGLEATALAERGLLLSDLDRYDDAIDLYGQSATKYRETGDQLSAAEMHIRIGEVYGSIGDLEEEEGRYKQALKEGEHAGEISDDLYYLGIENGKQETGNRKCKTG